MKKFKRTYLIIFALILTFIIDFFDLKPAFVQAATADVTVTEHYQTTDGKPIPGQVDTTTIVSSGEDYNKTVLVIPGYTASKYIVSTFPVPVSIIGPTVTVPASYFSGDFAVTFQYLVGDNVTSGSTSYTITEHYQDTDGKTLQGDTTSIVNSGQDYTKTVSIIPGYTAVNYITPAGTFQITDTSVTISNIFISSDIEVTYQYAAGEDATSGPISCTVTEHYKTTIGDTIQGDNTVIVTQGDNYSKDAPDIPGYTAVDIIIAGTATGSTTVSTPIYADTEITFVYDVDSENTTDAPVIGDHTITEEYQTTSGVTIHADTYTTVADGGSYDKDALAIPDYLAVDVLDPNGISLKSTGILMDHVYTDLTVTFLYVDDKNNNGIDDADENSTVVEKFQKEDGTPIAEDIATVVEFGGSFDAVPLVIENYVFTNSIMFNGEPKSGSSLQITSITENVEVIYIYKDDTGFNITEKYQDEDGAELQPDTVTNVPRNGSYAKDAPPIDGYTPVASKIDGVLQSGYNVSTDSVESDAEIIFIYAPVNLDTTEDTTSVDTTENTTEDTTSVDTTENTTEDTTSVDTTEDTTFNTTSVDTTEDTTFNTTSVDTIEDTTFNTTSVDTIEETTDNTTSIDTIEDTTFNTTSIDTTEETTIEDTTSVDTTNVTTINTTDNTAEIIGAAPVLKVVDYTVIDIGTQIDLSSLITEASDLEDGPVLNSQVVTSGNVNNLKAGVYPIEFSLTDSDGNISLATCNVSVKGQDTVIIGDNAIDAHDFSISASEVSTLTDADIIQKAGLTAWNIRQGTDITGNLQIDKTNIKSSAGQYKVLIKINILPAINSKDASGNDIVVVSASVYDSNLANLGGYGNLGDLPVAGEKHFNFNIFNFK